MGRTMHGLVGRNKALRSSGGCVAPAGTAKTCSGLIYFLQNFRQRQPRRTLRVIHILACYGYNTRN